MLAVFRDVFSAPCRLLSAADGFPDRAAAQANLRCEHGAAYRAVTEQLIIVDTFNGSPVAPGRFIAELGEIAGVTIYPKTGNWP